MRRRADADERARCRALPNVLSAGLRGGHEAAASNNLAGRNLRSARNRLAEALVVDPLRDELARLLGLFGGLEETKRAQNSVARLDEVVAGEAGEAAKLRHQRLVDLADDLVRPR